jgi:hypothetical protein
MIDRKELKRSMLAGYITYQYGRLDRGDAVESWPQVFHWLTGSFRYDSEDTVSSVDDIEQIITTSFPQLTNTFLAWKLLK